MVLPYEVTKSWANKVKQNTKHVANKTFLKLFLKSRKVSKNEECQVAVVITTANFHLTNHEFEVLCRFKSCQYIYIYIYIYILFSLDM